MLEELEASGAHKSTGDIKKACLIVHNLCDNIIGPQTSFQAKTANALQVHMNANDIPMPEGKVAKRHMIQVQYNPASLSLQASASDSEYVSMQQNSDIKIPNQKTRPPSITLGVDLIFDAVNPQDAFMLDKIRLSVGGIVSSVAGGRKKAEGGYTVRPQTNALLALAMRPMTKVVTFQWADMSFTGLVAEVQAKYEMFSVSGQPIRSRVRMSIEQSIESPREIMYWNKAMDKTFKEKGTFTGKTRDQTMGNILNLKAF